MPGESIGIAQPSIMGICRSSIKRDAKIFLVYFIVPMLFMLLPLNLGFFILGVIIFSPYLILGIYGLFISKTNSTTHITMYVVILRCAMLLFAVICIAAFFGFFTALYFIVRAKCDVTRDQNCALSATFMVFAMIVIGIVFAAALTSLLFSHFACKHANELKDSLSTQFQSLQISNLTGNQMINPSYVQMQTYPSGYSI